MQPPRPSITSFLPTFAWSDHSPSGRKAGQARLLVAALVSVCVLVFASPAVSHAATLGEYTVDITGTSASGWHVVGSGGHFRSSTDTITTGLGGYASWDDLRWRLDLPGNVHTAGGTIKLSTTTPSVPFAAVLRIGSAGASPRTIVSHLDSATYTDAIWSGADWIDAGLVAQSDTTLSISYSNKVVIGALHLVLADAVNPDATLDVPGATEWHGPTACIPINVTGTDADSGVVDLAVTDETAGLPVAAWHEQLAGLRPGLTLTQHQACVPTAGMLHGVNVLQLLATDAGGRTDVQRVQVRVDASAPTLTGGPGTAAVEAGHLAFTYDIADEGSGVADARVTLDGQTVNDAIDGGKLVVTPAARLTAGVHHLSITLVDQVGNERVEPRELTIVDDTPPAIAVSAPAESGGATPWLQAAATDAGSDIDPASWHVLVDGNPVALAAVQATIAGPLGMLTVGSHIVTIVVADTSGNVATVDRAYVVESTGGDADLTAVGARTGLFVVRSPGIPVTAGQPYVVSLLVAAAGRPLAGYRVVISGQGTDSDAITDARGVAVFRLVATGPTVLHARVADTTIDELAIPLQVSARLRLHAASSKAHVGAQVKLRGSVTADHAGERLQLEARIGSAWYPLRRSVTISRRGTFHTVVTSSVRGQVAVRVVLPARGGWSRGSSNVVLLTVR